MYLVLCILTSCWARLLASKFQGVYIGILGFLLKVSSHILCEFVQIFLVFHFF